MKQKVTKYLIALVAALLLAPTLAQAQTKTEYNDAGTSGLDFTLEQTSPGILQTLIDEIMSIKVNLPPEQAVITIDVSNYAKATIVGPNDFSGAMAIPATVDAGNAAAGAIRQLALDFGYLSIFTVGTYDAAVVLLEAANLLKINSGAIPVVAIGTDAFLNNMTITSLDMSGATNLQEIGTGTFSYSSVTGNLVIPDGVTTIGNHAFAYCSGLTGNLSFPTLGTLRTIRGDAFNGCSKLIGDVVLPYRVDSIGERAFANCAGLRSVTINSLWAEPRVPLTIGANVFSGCTSLEFIDMSYVPFADAMAQPASFSRSVNTNNPFYGVSAHTVIYLPTNADPARVTAAGANNFNFVLGGKCDWLYVQDVQDYYIPHTFTAAKATWNAAGTGAAITPNATRTLAAEFTTAYLPYNFTLSGLKGYALGHKNNHNPSSNTDNTFVFNQVTSFAANTPYVIRGASGTVFPEASDVSVPATSDAVGRIVYDASGASYDGGTAISNTNGGAPIPDPSKTGTWGIYGSTEAIPSNLWNTWDVYTLGGDAKWYQYVNKSASLPQFRAFIVGNGTPATSKPNFSFVNLDGTEDTTNSIDGLNVVNTGETHIYNVNGQYLGTDFNALPKGLYIVNGKKVIK